MATYNDLEKEIIRHLVDNRDNTMYYYLYLMRSILHNNECIRVVFSQECVELFINKNEIELMRISSLELNECIDNLLKRIIVFVLLLESLCKEHYIVLFGTTNKCNNSLSVGQPKNKTPYPIADSQIKELIFKYAASQVVVSEDLVALANRNFKTQEQCNIEKTQKISIFGIIAAFLTGIGGIFRETIVSFVKSLFNS